MSVYVLLFLTCVQLCHRGHVEALFIPFANTHTHTSYLHVPRHLHKHKHPGGTPSANKLPYSLNQRPASVLTQTRLNGSIRLVLSSGSLSTWPPAKHRVEHHTRVDVPTEVLQAVQELCRLVTENIEWNSGINMEGDTVPGETERPRLLRERAWRSSWKLTCLCPASQRRKKYSV